MKRFLVVPIVGAVLLVAAGCGTSPQAPGVARATGTPSASRGAGSTQLSTSDKQRLWLQYASCLRQHGFNEPDPTFDGSGDPQWGVSLKQVTRAAEDACAPILQSLGQHPSPPPSAAQLAALTRWAQCIRQHGVANFPDPDSQGNFPTNQDPKTMAGFRAAGRACMSLDPNTKP